MDKIEMLLFYISGRLAVSLQYGVVWDTHSYCRQNSTHRLRSSHKLKTLRDKRK